MLMVCYDFPPVASPGAHRADKLVTSLRRFGWEATVLCARLIPPRRYGASRLRDGDDGVPVHEVPSVEVDSTSWYRWRTKTDPDAATRSPMNSMSLLAGGAFWVPPAVRVGTKLLSASRHDVLFATGHPMRGLVVGKRLKDRSGIPLVLELRDPWIGPGGRRPRESPRLTHERNVEATTLRAADHVVAVTAPIVELLEDRYPSLAGHVSLLPNGFDPADFASDDRVPRSAQEGMFVIQNHGSILGLDGIQTLFRVLSRLCRESADFARMFQLQVIGGMTQENIDLLLEGLQPRPNVISLSRVDHAESVRLMRGSDVLLLVRSETWMFSMKIFDYLATGRPILVIAPQGSVAADLVHEAGAGIAVASNDEQALFDALARLFDDWRLGRTQPGPRQDVLKRFEWGNIAGRLAEIFDEVAANPGRIP